MTKFITIASAKGGTGKTVTAINTGLIMTKLGYGTVVVDANLETPHVALYLGSGTVQNTIHDALKGEKHITKTAYTHNSGLTIIPGRLYEERILHHRLGEELENLIGTASVVLIDTAAGMGEDVKQAMNISDEVVVVTNPDIVSVTDAMKTIRMATEMGKRIKGVVINKTTGHKHELTKQNIQEILEQPILASIPMNENFAHSTRMSQPIITLEPNSKTTDEFKKLAYQLLQ